MTTSSPGVALDDLLRRAPMASASVLADGGVASPTLTAARSLDVPESIRAAAPGELLVLTDPALLDDHFDALLATPPTAVAVRAAGSGEPFARLLAAADQHGFPVLLLPPGLGYDELSALLVREAQRGQEDVLERVDALHRALSQLVLDGSDLDSIAAEVSSVLGVGIMVTSTDGRERAAALDDDVRADLAARELFDPTGRFRVERIGADGLDLGHGDIRMTRIASAGADLAQLVCISPDRRLVAADVRALERSAMVVALLMTREHAVAAVEQKYRGDFLRDIFLSRAGSEEFIVDHVAGFGWDISRPLVVVSAEVDPVPEEEQPVSAQQVRGWQERFTAAWSQVCRARDESIPSVGFSAEVVTLLPAPPGADGAVDLEALRAHVDEVVDEVAGDRGGGRRPFSVGVSRVVTDLAGLPAGYEQARRAVVVGRRVHGTRSTTWFDDLGVHRLIALVPDRRELREFAVDVLGELAEETEEARNLRTTLQILLDTNFNVAESARLQFFHYNTMRYRLTKLERMLGPFSTDAHQRLNIAVALQVVAMPD